jgi:hypothetical protein
VVLVFLCHAFVVITGHSLYCFGTCAGCCLFIMSRSRSRTRGIPASPVLPEWSTIRRKSRAALSRPTVNSMSRSASRNSSRGRRNSITDEYKRRSISADRVRDFDHMIAQAGGNPRPTKVRRWDGNCRATTNWDCIGQVKCQTRSKPILIKHRIRNYGLQTVTA